MKKREPQNYIDSSELYDEYEKSKQHTFIDDDGVERPIGTERIGQMFLMICDGVLKCPSFARYPQAWKEDMKQYALYKLIRGIRTFKLFEDQTTETDKEKYKHKAFSYTTRAVFLSYISELSRHYKQENIKRSMLIDTWKELQIFNPELAQRFEREFLQVDSNYGLCHDKWVSSRHPSEEKMS